MIRRGPEVINPEYVTTRSAVGRQSLLQLERPVCIATLPNGRSLILLGSLTQLGFWLDQEAEYGLHGLHRERLSTVAEVFRDRRFDDFPERELARFSKPVDEIRAEIQGGHRLLVEGPYMIPTEPGAPASLIRGRRALWAPVQQVFVRGLTPWVLK